MLEQSANLKRIAELSGVSVMTVSRVLRNQPNVSPATRDTVLRIARELDYKPNPLVSALMSSRRRRGVTASAITIGFLTSFPARHGWRREPLYQQFHEGALDAADKHGYKVEEFWLREPGMTPQRLSQILFNRNITGLVIAPLPMAQGELPMDWENFSAVAFGHSLANPSLHRFANHQFRSMRLALRHLRELGYKRVGLALPASLNERVIQLWLGGYLVEAQQSEGCPVPPLLLKDAEWDQSRFAAWVSQFSPDAVICHSCDPMDWISAMGLKIPEDIGFVYLNCESSSGPISGIYQNGHAVGVAAIEFLIGMIQRNDRGVPEIAQSVLIEGSWVQGTTVRPPNIGRVPSSGEKV